MTSIIYNSLASSDLGITELVDPDQISFYTASLANQVNAFRMNYTPQKRIIDLAEWVSDITIETTAQGGSLLEVTIIDPAWTLFQRDAAGVCFIDVDDQGFLWPPVEVTFPPDVSDATWRLCQCIPTTDLTQANVTLTFEDKIVSELREHYGAQISYPNQTRAEFIQMLVQQANRNPAYPGEVSIRLVNLLPKSTFTVEDLNLQERLPASATQAYAPPARKNPNKNAKTPTVASSLPKPLTQGEIAAGVVDLSIEDGLAAYQKGTSYANTYSPFATPPPGPRVGIG